MIKLGPTANNGIAKQPAPIAQPATINKLETKCLPNKVLLL